MYKDTSLKLYYVGLLDYMFALIAFFDIVDHWLRIVAAVGVIISTWYLIRKYKSENELNQIRKKKELMEVEIKEQELANVIAKNKT